MTLARLASFGRWVWTTIRYSNAYSPYFHGISLNHEVSQDLKSGKCLGITVGGVILLQNWRPTVFQVCRGWSKIFGSQQKLVKNLRFSAKTPPIPEMFHQKTGLFCVQILGSFLTKKLRFTSSCFFVMMFCSGIFHNHHLLESHFFRFLFQVGRSARRVFSELAIMINQKKWHQKLAISWFIHRNNIYEGAKKACSMFGTP